MPRRPRRPCPHPGCPRFRPCALHPTSTPYRGSLVVATALEDSFGEWITAATTLRVEDRAKLAVIIRAKVRRGSDATKAARLRQAVRDHPDRRAKDCHRAAEVNDCAIARADEFDTAVPTGFEPAISSLTGTYARPLHHGTVSEGARRGRSSWLGRLLRRSRRNLRARRIIARHEGKKGGGCASFHPPPCRCGQPQLG